MARVLAVGGRAAAAASVIALLVPRLAAMKPAAANPAPSAMRADILVVGATPGGITFAVRAAREGANVVLVTHYAHLGGMLSSGLGVWDTLYEGRRAPIYDEVRQAIVDHYDHTYGADSPQARAARPSPDGDANAKFEPRVAEEILTRLVAAESRIALLKRYDPVAVERTGAVVRSVTFRACDGSGRVRIEAKIVADCTYEADVLPLARVRYRVGREARAEFDEPHAGVVFVAPAEQPPNEDLRRQKQIHDELKLRRFPGFETVLAASTGGSDANVQAGNIRTILTSDPTNRLPIEKPAGYDASAAGRLEFGASIKPIPNRKLSLNRPQLLGTQNAWVEGDWATRDRVMDAHWQACLAVLWFQQHDPAVPEAERQYWQQWGLPKNEFVDNGHRPYEFYLREGRRLHGRFTFTEHDVTLAPGLRRAPVHIDSIAMTEWYMDCHPCTARTVPGSYKEGKFMLHAISFPGQLPYRALLPSDVDNLLVPVNVSASHVAWNTVRLEATWMNIAESAAFAAVQALRHGQSPAAIDIDELLLTLAARHVALSFFNDVDPASNAPGVAAAEYFATKGFFPTYDARLDATLDPTTAAVWASALNEMHARHLDPDAALARLANAPPATGAVSEAEFAAQLPPAARPRTASSEAITRRRALEWMWNSFPSVQREQMARAADPIAAPPLSSAAGE